MAFVVIELSEIFSRSKKVQIGFPPASGRVVIRSLFSKKVEKLDLVNIVGKSSGDVRSVTLICFRLDGIS